MGRTYRLDAQDIEDLAVLKVYERLCSSLSSRDLNTAGRALLEYAALKHGGDVSLNREVVGRLEEDVRAGRLEIPRFQDVIAAIYRC